MYIYDVMVNSQDTQTMVKFDSPIEIYDYLSIHAYTVITNFTLTHHSTYKTRDKTYQLVIDTQKLVDKWSRIFADTWMEEGKANDKVMQIVQDAVNDINNLIK